MITLNLLFCKTINLFTITSLMLILWIGSASAKEVLQGQINKNGYNLSPDVDYAETNSPSLSRQDLGTLAGSPSSALNPPAPDETSLHQSIDLPKEALQSLSTTPQIQIPTFGLNAEQNGQMNFAGQEMPGKTDQAALLPENASEGALVPQQYYTALTDGSPQTSGTAANIDPDSTPQMQLAWDQWHRQVAQAIFERFNFFASKVFSPDPSLVATVSYIVTSNGQVQNVHLVKASPNDMFNALALQCVQSINGNTQLLKFPQGSQRTSVSKLGVFDRAGHGFRYTIGDREIVPAR